MYFFIIRAIKIMHSLKARFHAHYKIKLNCTATIILKDIVFLIDSIVKIIWVLVLHRMPLYVNLLLMWITPRKSYWQGIFVCFKPQVLCCTSLLSAPINANIWIKNGCQKLKIKVKQTAKKLHLLRTKAILQNYSEFIELWLKYNKLINGLFSFLSVRK